MVTTRGRGVQGVRGCRDHWAHILQDSGCWALISPAILRASLRRALTCGPALRQPASSMGGDRPGLGVHLHPQGRCWPAWPWAPELHSVAVSSHHVAPCQPWRREGQAHRACCCVSAGGSALSGPETQQPAHLGSTLGPCGRAGTARLTAAGFAPAPGRPQVRGGARTTGGGGGENARSRVRSAVRTPKARSRMALHTHELR